MLLYSLIIPFQPLDPTKLKLKYFIMANLKMDRDGEEELKFGQMVQFMLDNGKMEWRTVKAD